jgi:hypothetical protein
LRIVGSDEPDSGTQGGARLHRIRTPLRCVLKARGPKCRSCLRSLAHRRPTGHRDGCADLRMRRARRTCGLRCGVQSPQNVPSSIATMRVASDSSNIVTSDLRWVDHGPPDQFESKVHHMPALPASDGEEPFSALEGGCLCGDIRYRLKSPPKAIVLCDCTHCQRQGGSAFLVNLICPEADYEQLGQTTVYHDRGDSGFAVSRHFCGRCGSPVLTNAASVPGAHHQRGVDLRNGLRRPLPQPIGRARARSGCSPRPWHSNSLRMASA